MSHQPWTKEDAEKWADEHNEKNVDFHPSAYVWSKRAFLAGMEKAAEVIEACETIRYTLRDGKVHTGSFEVFEAKLVGARPIDSDGSVNEEKK